MTTNNSWDTKLPAEVKDGMTGKSSFTPYCLTSAGTTNINPLQNNNIGNLYQVLYSKGPSALADWEDLVQPTYVTFRGSGVLFFDPFNGFLYNTYILSINQVFAVSGAQTSIYLNYCDTLGDPITTNYLSGTINYSYNSSALTNSNDTTSIILSTNILPTNKASGTFYITNVLNGSYINCYGIMQNSDGTTNISFSTYTGNTPIGFLQITPNAGFPSGNAYSYTATIYGVPD